MWLWDNIKVSQEYFPCVEADCGTELNIINIFIIQIILMIFFMRTWSPGREEELSRHCSHPFLRPPRRFPSCPPCWRRWRSPAPSWRCPARSLLEKRRRKNTGIFRTWSDLLALPSDWETLRLNLEQANFFSFPSLKLIFSSLLSSVLCLKWKWTNMKYGDIAPAPPDT